jgi:tripartite-type tricarboxylate transporter receptor subunit TctC
VLVVPAGAPWKTTAELIAAAKAEPGKLTFGSAGIGSQVHLAAENFVATAGIDAVHVPYKGEGPALSALVGGETNFMVTNVAAALVHVKSGRLRALGVTSKAEFPQLPGVPPIAQTLRGFENSGWFGIVAPTGTPKPIIEKVYRDTKVALQDQKMRERFSAQGLQPVGNSPEEMRKAMREETQLWARVVKQRNIHVK